MTGKCKVRTSLWPWDQGGRRGGALGAAASPAVILGLHPRAMFSGREGGLKWRQDICGALSMCPAP